MSRSRASYLQALRSLLPRGLAWDMSPGSLLAKLFEGLAAEMERGDMRISVLRDEADPRTALELLPEWERVAGLPDPCVPAAPTTGERQRRVAAKIAGVGGQTPAFYIDLAARMGITIAVEEFRPFTVGSRIGTPLMGANWRHAWRIRLLRFSDIAVMPRESFFRAGSRVGERLRSVSVDELECVMRRAAPAHSIVLFAYPSDPSPTLWFDFLSDQGEY